ncbi:MAG: hypothetical protein CSA33_08285 [Desulfobulbus propionicus]|nr:MAG: hypothetical protein CSA33_08285 [Desulfobulbus propionicus]
MIFPLGGWVLGLWACMVGCLVSSAMAAGSCAGYGDLVTNGGYGLFDLETKAVHGCNLDTLYVPASVLKLATAYTAIQILGKDFRFETRFYQDAEQNLYLKGSGDPFLTSEAVAQIVETLKQLGLNRVHDLVIDDTAYALDEYAPGSAFSENPYDAPVGAAAVNFNTVSFVVGGDNRVHTAEPQTPLLPLMLEKAQGKGQGQYRVNICSGDCRPQQAAAEYAAELFQAFFKEHNMLVTGGVTRKRVPENARLLYVFQSAKTLEEMTASMLYYSSNFVANQIFLACGAHAYGAPATWKKSIQAERAVLGSILGSDWAASAKILDGAGLARGGRMSIRTTLELLAHFFPYHSLLRKRQGVWVKSGTMENVYNYAGYLDEKTAFVIYLNQPENSRVQVLKRVQHQHSQNASNKNGHLSTCE